MFLLNCSSPRPLSNTGCARQYTGSEKQAEPVVVLNPVSTNEFQTKDQVAEKDPTQHTDKEGEITPEYKDDSIEKIRDTDSSNCWPENRKATRLEVLFNKHMISPGVPARAVGTLFLSLYSESNSFLISLL